MQGWIGSWDVECSGCSVLSPMEIKLKLPVTLNDGSMNLKTTLKSPDAEKICPITAIAIKKHEDQGVTVLDVISLVMDNTEVVCFVKHYDKRINDESTRRYVLLKLYTPDEMKAFNEAPVTSVDTTVPLGSQTPGISAAGMMPLSPARVQPPAVEQQFFSPTVKNVLTQIDKGSHEAGSSCSNTSPAKRTIHFSSITDEDLTNIHTDDPEARPAQAAETPKKKTKAGDKHP